MGGKTAHYEFLPTGFYLHKDDIGHQMRLLSLEEIDYMADHGQLYIGVWRREELGRQMPIFQDRFKRKIEVEKGLIQVGEDFRVFEYLSQESGVTL